MESVVITAEQAGFTLIELMIVIAILAIFVVVGVPNFQNLVKDNRLSTQANRLVSSLQLARSEALKLRTPVSVCRSTDGAACAGSGAWESGWLVFVDSGTLGTVDGTDTIVKTVGQLGAGNTLRGNAGVNNFISYQPTGLQNTGNGAFRLCDGNDPDTDKGRTISISATGRISSSKTVASCL